MMKIMHRGTDPEAIKIGEQYGLSFDGMQEGYEDIPDQYTFTVQRGDPAIKGATFLVDKLEDVPVRLNEKLNEFGITPKVGGAIPEVAPKVGGQPFTPETTWAIDDITSKGGKYSGKELMAIDDAIDMWTRQEPGDIRKVTRLTRVNLEYLDALHKILKEQYGDEIIVYRGGGFYRVGGKPIKGAISVTTNEAIAKCFVYGGEIDRFVVDTNKVLAASPTLESELIVYVSDLKPIATQSSSEVTPKVEKAVLSQITESIHPVIKQWLEDGWEVARPQDMGEQGVLREFGFEPSASLHNIWYRKPVQSMLMEEVEDKSEVQGCPQKFVGGKRKPQFGAYPSVSQLFE